MIASFGMDTLILCVGIGSGLMGLGLGAFMLRRSRVQPSLANAEDNTVDDIVRKAPYHRLHNVLKVEARR